jgi:hypothetical protein
MSRRFKWWLIRFLAGHDTVIINCFFQGDSVHLRNRAFIDSNSVVGTKFFMTGKELNLNTLKLVEE